MLERFVRKHNISYLRRPSLWSRAWERIEDASASIKKKKLFWAAAGTWPASVGSLPTKIQLAYTRKHALHPHSMFWSSIGMSAVVAGAISYGAISVGGWAQALGGWYVAGMVANSAIRIGQYIQKKEPVPSYFSPLYLPINIINNIDARIAKNIGYSPISRAYRGTRNALIHTAQDFRDSFADWRMSLKYNNGPRYSYA